MLISEQPDFEALRRKYAPLSDDVWKVKSPREQRIIMRRSFPDFALRNLKIRAKTKEARAGAIIPLRLNDSQLFLHDICERMKAEVGYVRVLVLKARQVGMSTAIGGRIFQKTTQYMGQKASILAHDETASQTLFDMVELMYEECDPRIRPPADRQSAKQLRFQTLRGGYKVSSAAGKAPGRSDMFHALHWSEASSTKNADEILSGALQCVPLLPNTEGYIESTPKGRSGTFYQLWIDAVNETDPKLGYWAVFIPWYWHDEYRMPVPEDFRPSIEEAKLARMYKLDPDQIMFRRHVMASMKPSDGGSRSDLYRQEYASSWQESFLFSGRPVFEREDLILAEHACTTPKFRGDIRFTKRRFPGRVNRREDGPLKIWVKPVKGRQYICASDSAEGLVDGDFSTAVVMDLLDGSTVATYRAHIPPSEFGLVLCALGWLYNVAQLCPETMFSDATLAKIQECGYMNIFQREVFDSSIGDKTRRWGWRTTKSSKNTAIDMLNEDLMDGVPMRDKALVDEMGQFIIHDDQRRGAGPGFHDDLVMARAIASACWRLHPKYRKRVQTVMDRRKQQEILDMKVKQKKTEVLTRGFLRQKSERPIKMTPSMKLAEQIVKREVAKAMEAMKPPNRPDPAAQQPIGTFANRPQRHRRQFGG